MKVSPFLFALILISSLTFAQTTPADSSIIVASPASVSHYGGPAAPQDLYAKGRVDAEAHYKKYKGAATGTLIARLVSPLIGLIPAIACSAATPRIENLGYPDEKLFMQKEYHDSYTRRATLRLRSGSTPSAKLRDHISILALGGADH